MESFSILAHHMRDTHDPRDDWAAADWDHDYEDFVENAEPDWDMSYHLAQHPKFNVRDFVHEGQDEDSDWHDWQNNTQVLNPQPEDTYDIDTYYHIN